MGKGRDYAARQTMVFNDDREPPCRADAGVEHFPARPIPVLGDLGIFRNPHNGQFMSVELLVLTTMLPTLWLQHNGPTEPVLDRSNYLTLFESQRDHPLLSVRASRQDLFCQVKSSTTLI